jgi:hypothetical protein
MSTSKINNCAAGWLVAAAIAGWLMTAGNGPALGSDAQAPDRKAVIKIKDLGGHSDSSYKVRVGDQEVEIDYRGARAGNIYVGPADTVSDDVVTKGGSITVDGMVTGDCISLGGPVKVNGTVLGDVAAFGGAVEVNGSVKGDLASFGGPIAVEGSVGKDIASFGGPVKLGARAEVGGDIAVMGGSIEKPDGAVVRGEIKNIDLGMLNSFIPRIIGSSGRQERPGSSAVSRAVKFLVVLFMLAGLGIMVLLLGTFFSKPIERIVHIIEVDFWKSAGIGFLIQICIAPALTFMAVSILGIPLIPLAILLVVAAILMSIAGFGVIINRKLGHALGRPAMKTLPAVALGFVLLHSLFLLGSLVSIAGSPLTALGVIFAIINSIVLWCGITVGLGAVWTTRLGTREQIPAPVARI